MNTNNNIYSCFRAIKTEVGWLARKSIDFLVGLTQKTKFSHVNQKKKLLIVRTDAIGDFIIFTGTLPYFRELYSSSHWEITLLGSKECKIIAEFVKSGIISSEPVFDHFLSINRSAFSRNLIYRFQLQKFLQSLSYDLVIYPVYSRTRDGDQLINIINSPQKIAIDGDCSSGIPLGVKLTNNQTIYTKLIRLEEGWLSEVERNVSFLKQLGIKETIDGVPKWKMPLDMMTTAIKLAHSNGIENDFAIICPGASVDYRIWTAHKVAEVTDYLWNKYKLPTLICGSAKDKIISLEIQKSLKSAKVVCLCGEINLIELSALMSYGKICITMDSGPAHIAVAVNAPLICVIGGGHYKRFFPYGDSNRFRAVTEELDCFYCNWRCKFSKPFCVQDISVTTVIKEIDNLMIVVYNQEA
jgi:ADP-heptose:LPS heptosyltransferase